MVMCHHCGKIPATVTLKKILSNHKEEIHLCAECAKEEAGAFNFHLDPSFALQNLLAGLMEQENFYSSATEKNGEFQAQCSGCGLNYEQFKKTGRFGCSTCYEEFKPFLLSFLQRIHGSSKHIGKVFAVAEGFPAVDQEINKLKRKLEELVTREKYEEAAKLRDRIKELE